MARSLKDLSEEERKALLNAHWDDLVRKDGSGDLASPLGQTAKVPADIASHLLPGRANPAAWGIVNGGGCGKSALEQLGDLKNLANDKLAGG